MRAEFIMISDSHSFFYRYYDFLYNFRKRVRCSYGHFQLRNLVWATSNHDVWYMNHHSIHHMFTPSQKVTRFVDLRGGKFHIGRVQISSMAVREGLCVVGGFHGELHVTNIERCALSRKKM